VRFVSTTLSSCDIRGARGNFSVFKIKRGRRLIAQSVGVAVVGGGLALAVATTGSASTTLNLTNHTPITATSSGCSDVPSDMLSQIPSTDDIWHFVTGKDTFASVSPAFNPSTGVIGPIYEHGMTQAYFGTTAGAVLVSATADVNGTATNPQFTLSSTCAATSSSPSPRPSPSGSPKPSGSPSSSPHPSGSPSSPPGAPTPTPVTGNLPVTG
jgi:hypothetical protein